MDKFQPKHIKRWFEYVNYEGENFDSYYIAAWRFFRCTPLERANFKYIKTHLQDCGDTGVIFPMFTDEVMMRRYYILVHEDSTKALKMADMFAERIKRKSSLDPEAEFQLNWEGIIKLWHLRSMQSKIDLCNEAEISIFAARRKNPTHESLIELLSEAA